ncbi:MAG: hypothetical protein ACM3MG_01535 [Bacillota bacterium]
MKKLFAAILISIFTVGAMAAIDGNNMRTDYDHPAHGGGGFHGNPGHGGGFPGHPGHDGGWNPPPSHGGGSGGDYWGGGDWGGGDYWGGGWGGDGRPVVTCSASDRGWEEHFGGHRDCNSCLRKHGQCVETCSAESYRSVAEGLDYRGYRMTVEARGQTQYQTERKAFERCARMYRYSNCRIVSTTPKKEIISRRSCR